MYTNKKKICIVLPNKIGDSILAIPFLICLKQLVQKYKKNYCITIFCSNGLTSVFKSLDIFPVKKSSLIEKLKSQLFQYDKAVFLDTSSRNMFLKAKLTLGMNLDAKKYITFDKNLPFLDPRASRDPIPQDLCNHLTDSINLAVTSSAFVAINLYLGFSKEQIMETFEFSQKAINTENIEKAQIPELDSQYLICCMEAGSGHSSAKDRLWEYNNYFSIAEYLYQKYKLKTVFIGIEKSNAIPQQSYLIDLRGKLDLLQTTKVISGANAYIGNDTGPLHMANLLKKPSIALYGRQETEIQYSPIFPELNVQLFRPDVHDVINNIDLLMQKSGNFCQS